MVALVGMLSPVPQASAREALTISKDTIAILERSLAEMAELVAPLSSASTRAELVRVLERAAPEYLHLRNEVGRLIMDQLAEDSFIQFASKAYDYWLGLVRNDTAVLGPRDRDLMLDTLESHRDMVEGVVECLKANPGATLDVVVESSPALLRLDMCELAILLVLGGEISRWNPNSIKLLSRVAHEYMEQVEDKFLAHDAELAERLRTRGPGIGLEQVKKAIGLPR